MIKYLKENNKYLIQILRLNISISNTDLEF